MDVLQVIKEEHNKIRYLASRFMEAETLADRRSFFQELEFHLSSHLRIERDFLYPEVEDSGLNTPPSFFVVSNENHKRLRQALKNVANALTKKVNKSNHFEFLCDLAVAHSDLEESVLMPKMRMAVPTQEREDLGLVYLDMIAEFPEISKTDRSRRGRKSA